MIASIEPAPQGSEKATIASIEPAPQGSEKATIASIEPAPLESEKATIASMEPRSRHRAILSPSSAPAGRARLQPAPGLRCRCSPSRPL